jgi:hypothetical protein
MNCSLPRKEKIMGEIFGRFIVAFIDNDLFCGFAFRVGKDCTDGGYYITLQFGYGMLLIGFR